MTEKFFNFVKENPPTNQEEIEETCKRLWDEIKTSVTKDLEELSSTEYKVLDKYIRLKLIHAIRYYNIDIKISGIQTTKKAYDSLLHSICCHCIDWISDPNGVINGRFKRQNRPLLSVVIFSHDEDAHNIENLDTCGCSLIKMIIDYGADVNATDERRWTPFFFAVYKSSPDIMQMLLDTGMIDVNATDHEGNTVLYDFDLSESKSFLDNYGKCLQILKESGCDENYKGQVHTGNSPLHELITLERHEPIKLFIEIFKPRISLKNNFGLTPLHYYVKYRRDKECEVLKYFSTHLSNDIVNERDFCMKTPLHYAIEENMPYMYNLDRIKLLIAFGADVNLPDKNGCGPLHYALASEEEGTELIQLLLNHNVNLEATDCFGDMPIAYAAAYSSTEIFTMLLPFYKVTDKLRDRLLSIAYLNDNRDMIKMMYSEKKDIFLSLQEIDAEKSGDDDVKKQDELLQIKYPYMCYNTIEHTIPEFEPMITPNGLREWKKKQIESYNDDSNKGKRSQKDHFHDLENDRKFENKQILDEVMELINRISRHVKERNPIFGFHPILSGSCSEGTKIGVMDEVDFLCCLDVLSSFNLSAVQCENDAAYFHLCSSQRIKELEPSLFIEYAGKWCLSSKIVGSQFNMAVCDALSGDQLLKDLHLCLPGEIMPDKAISNVTFIWTGKNYKSREINLDLVPTICINAICKPQESSITLIEHLHVENSLDKRLFISKMVYKDEASWRISHSLVETNIFQQLPENIRIGYKLVKLLRSSNIIDALHRNLKSSELITYHFKTCLFYELTDHLEQNIELDLKTPEYWASRILYRLKFVVSNGEITNFFIPGVSIGLTHRSDIRTAKAFSIAGKEWLEFPWLSYDSI